MSFGGGAWLCAGSEFAKLEMVVFIHSEERRYDNERRAGWDYVPSNCSRGVVRVLRPFPRRQVFEAGGNRRRRRADSGEHHECTWVTVIVE
ncbi:unnamed protein product [Linum tenue]|uniref:Cytochrome P450 n=1 Tax=Linum tenue TaxID=586396 RepID=A0AAV0KUC0_9ROSI|nr:unnamed protein product [Linum tenue]